MDYYFVVEKVKYLIHINPVEHSIFNSMGGTFYPKNLDLI